MGSSLNVCRQLRVGREKVGSTFGTVKAWADSHVSAVKEKLRIHSQSRVFAQLAGFTVQEFNNGIDDKARSTAADNTKDGLTMDEKGACL